MYKGLGRKAAKNTGSFKPEAARKGTDNYFFIIAFEKIGGELKRHRVVLKDQSREQAQKVADKMLKDLNLSYLSIINKPWCMAPEIIFEQGDKSLVDAWLKKAKKK